MSSSLKISDFDLKCDKPIKKKEIKKHCLTNHVKNHKIYTRMKGMRYTCPNSSTRSEVFAFAGSSVG